MPTAKETTAMRDAVKKAYPGSAWSKKINLMPLDKVTEMYNNLKIQNKI
jgi:hypothetical protein